MRVITFLFFILFVSLSRAGTAVGQVSYVQAGHGYTVNDVYFLVQINGQRQEVPSCAEPGDSRMAINPATEAGKAMLSMLLAAHAANKSVELFGSGDCTVMTTHYEDISYIRVR